MQPLLGFILQYDLKDLKFAARARRDLLSSSPLHCIMAAQAISLSSMPPEWLPCWSASLRGLLPAAGGGLMQAELPIIEVKASIFVTSTPSTGGTGASRSSSMPEKLTIASELRHHYEQTHGSIAFSRLFDCLKACSDLSLGFFAVIAASGGLTPRRQVWVD